MAAVDRHCRCAWDRRARSLREGAAAPEACASASSSSRRAEIEEARSMPVLSLMRCTALAAPVGLPVFFSAMDAQAGGTGEIVPPGTAATVDATGVLIQIGLLTAFVGLIVLTGGVAYLSYKDWQEKQEAKKFMEKEATSVRGSDGSPADKADRSSPKGFGKK
eukprot:SM000096S24901  [mRNA]  locus=s96:502494:503669:+ [translate_table: standard]